MKYLYLIIFLMPLVVLTESEKPVGYYNAYVNKVEDTDLITVYTDAGLNTRNCTKIKDTPTSSERCKEAIGWLDRYSKVRIVDGSQPITVKVPDPSGETDEWSDEEFIEVEYSYTRLGANGKWYSNSKRGFVEKKDISDRPMTPFYSKTEEPKSGSPSKPMAAPPARTIKDCTATATSAQLKDLQNICRPIADSLGEKMGVYETAAALNEVVGVCATWPPTRLPKVLPEGNIYDRIVYPALVRNQAKIPALKGENGKRITLQEVATIDALARTLYGEMGKCFRHGLQYPMAVAKIAVNRVSAPQKYESIFVQGSHHPNKTKLMKVLTTPSQFKVWDTKNAETGGPLHHGLCPPRQLGQPFYANKSAPKMEYDNWVNSMRIATEAVLFPAQFAKKTKNVTEFHYTSKRQHLRGTRDLPRGASFIEKMTLVHPDIEGRKITNNACVEVWRDKQ